MESENELIQIRIEKIKEIADTFEVNPYPYKYEVTHKIRDVLNQFEQLSQAGKEISIAGRIMARRLMGKVSFAVIQDSTERMQFYLALKNIGEMSYAMFKKLDIGDIIGLKGSVKLTQKGEKTLFVDQLTLLTKNIRPLPVVKEKDGKVFDAFADKERRYRDRHVDLIVSPDVKETFIKRLQIIKKIRAILDERNFLEVETPVLQPVYGGANASPFTTHHNALSTDLYMRISLEPYLKKLIVGGFDRVYEISKVFRNEGIDKNHNPEFTLLELYQAYADFQDMMSLTEDIFKYVCQSIHGSLEVSWQGKNINLSQPFKKIKMLEALKEYGGFDPEVLSDKALAEKMEKKGGELKGDFNRGRCLDKLFELYVEEHIVQPTFVTHHPVETSPLCKVDYDDPRFLQRFELFMGGQEMANAYSEANDPVFQRKTLQAQADRRSVDEEAPPMDESFIQAIEIGMPPTGGLGIGVDRMVMLLTDQKSIRDVIFFPVMKVE